MSKMLCSFVNCLCLTALTGCGGQPATTNHSTPSEVSPSASSDSVTLPKGEFVDLSHSFDEQTIYWPTEDGFRFVKQQADFTKGGYFYAANVFTTPEHGGTHIDAPIHFFKDRHTVDKIPLDRLIAEAAVVDVSKKCDKNRDYQVGVSDLRNWEEKHGRVFKDVIVLLNTGWGAHWPNREKYLGTNESGQGAIAKLHFPGLDPEAARWLVEHRAIKAIGIDTPSIDYGQSTKFQSHITLFEHNVPAFENVANVDKLPSQGAMVIALPMKISDGSGGPLRIIAIMADKFKDSR